MQLIVDRAQRYAKMRSHTATHLLHLALQNYFPDTKQAGSMNDSDYVRFDFTTQRALTLDEITEIESYMQGVIAAAHDVSVEEMGYDDAVAAGAKAFFEDKYGDTVRVVTVHDTPSVELCGGTHVTNTSHIGAFAIVAQEAVASGVKRIIAYTGPKVNEYVASKTSLLASIRKVVDASSDEHIINKIEKQHKQLAAVEKEKEAMSRAVIGAHIDGLTAGSGAFAYSIDATTLGNIKDVVQIVKEKGVSAIVYTGAGQFAVVSTKEGTDAKAWASENGLRGGGSPLLFQGKDEKILSLV